MRVPTSLDVAGDIAAFHRQRTAIARDAADGVFGDFLDTLCGHDASALPNPFLSGIEAKPLLFR